MVPGGVNAQTELSLWTHSADNDRERAAIEQLVETFNASQSDWHLVMRSFLQEGYANSVVISGSSGRLPDILDVDLPVLPNWVWSGFLQPLPLDTPEFDGFLSSALGVWNGKVYGVGLWEGAVAIVARRSVLEHHNIRIPTVAQPWTVTEFDAALTAIDAEGRHTYALDLGLAERGEWYPYAFGAFLKSFGGDIMQVNPRSTAQGVLNGEAGLAFGNWWQSLFVRDLVPGPSQNKHQRETGFVDGRYAMRLTGNWDALDLADKIGNDLLILPPPDMGIRPVVGAGSWQFAASSGSRHPDGAAAFIRFATRNTHLTALSDTLGVIPPTDSAAASSRSYGPGTPLEPFHRISKAFNELRPMSPGYVVAGKVFERALLEIASGADVKTILDAAAVDIDADIARNDGYRN